MRRRTINLPETIDELARSLAREGESFSATVARLIEEADRAQRGPRRPSWVASFDGPDDLGVNAERYLRELVDLR